MASNVLKGRYIVLGFFLLLSLFFLRSNPGDSIFLTHYGEIQIGFESEALFVRDEFIQTSPVEGTVDDILMAEGVRVRGGAPIITVETSRGMQTIYSIRPGILSFKYDHLEDEFNALDDDDVSPRLFEGVDNSYTVRHSGDTVQKGDPLFRLVEGIRLHLLVKLPQGAPVPSIGQRVQVTFPRLCGEEYRARVVQIEPGILLLEVRELIDEFLSLRRQPVHIILQKHYGLMVPRETIHSLEGVTGVWIMGQRNTWFQPIQIRGYNDEYAIVDGIRVGDQILYQEPSHQERGGNDE